MSTGDSGVFGVCNQSALSTAWAKSQPVCLLYEERGWSQRGTRGQVPALRTHNLHRRDYIVSMEVELGRSSDSVKNSAFGGELAKAVKCSYLHRDCPPSMPIDQNMAYNRLIFHFTKHVLDHADGVFPCVCKIKGGQRAHVLTLGKPVLYSGWVTSCLAISKSLLPGPGEWDICGL